MTAGAEGVACRAQLSAVRIMAVAAGDAVRVHFALQERTPVVDLASLLTVGVIQRIREQCRTVVVEQWLARLVAVRDLATQPVTLRADTDLTFGQARLRAAGVASGNDRHPRNTSPFVEANRQPLVVVALD